MSLPLILADSVPDGSLVLVLNDAETRLQMVLGRWPIGQSAPQATATGRKIRPQSDILAVQEWTANARGTEILMPALDGIFHMLGLEQRHLGRIAVVNGPGGFTGLRLTSMTAAALARGCSPDAPLPQAPLHYCEVLASSACLHMGRTGGAASLFGETMPCFAVITHARSDLVHAQAFTLPAQHHATEDTAPIAHAGGATSEKPSVIPPLPDTKNKPTRLHPCAPLSVMRVEQCAEWLRALHHTGSLAVLGSGLTKHSDVFARACGIQALPGAGDYSPTLALLPPLFDTPLPQALYEAALCAKYGGDVQPLYARESEAEENLESIAPRLGMDPQEARARLTDLLKNKP